MAVRSNRRANNERESRGTSPMITASKHISLSFSSLLISSLPSQHQIETKEKEEEDEQRHYVKEFLWPCLSLSHGHTVSNEDAVETRETQETSDPEIASSFF